MKKPVCLVHGIADTTITMEPMARALRAAGWDAFTIGFTPKFGQGLLDELAVQVAKKIDDRVGPDQPCDVIGFSMGGLVTRYMIQRLGWITRAQRFVTISTPHHGTLAAHALPLDGVRQMRPGSAFLRDLASDADMLRSIAFTSLWTPMDLIILPASSSIMPQAENIRLNVIAHPLMILDRRATAAVIHGLSKPVLSASCESSRGELATASSVLDGKMA